MIKPSKNELSKKGLLNKPLRKQYQRPINQVGRNSYFDLIGIAITILLGIAIYSNSFNCSFHFDDFARIVYNPNIRNLADAKAWMNIYPSRPVGMFTFALNYYFNQLNVFYYHLVNLIIHLINACLVWWITLLIFSSPALNDNPIIKQKKVIAFFTALLFVSHPLATQSITYICQRFACLVTMFFLLSLILYVKARLSNKGNISKTLLFACSLISAVLAMLTKENAFTLPFAIVLFELFFLRTKKFSINFKDYRVILLLAAFLGVMLIIPLQFSFSIFKPIPPRLGHTYFLTPVNYLFTQFSVIVKYIQLLLLPIDQKLNYDFPISNNFFEIRTILCFLFLLSLIILAIFLFNKHRVISFCIFWFFLTSLIESSLIPIDDVIWEHRTYLPSFGFFLILTLGIYFFLWNKSKYLTISIFVLLIGSNSYLTYERNKIWKDDPSLLNDNVAKTPNLTRVLLNRGIAYRRLGQWEKAIDDYSRVIDINPKYAQAYYNRGIAKKSIQDYHGAIADYSKAIEIDPKYIQAYNNRGVLKVNLQDYQGAIADYSDALEIDPKYIQAYNNRGAAFCTLGQWDKAIADFSKMIEIDPTNSKAYSNREFAYKKLHREKKQ